MTKVNKIIKYELENEVDSLLENGVALHRIASIIKDNHPDIKDLQKISNMSIMRYRDTREKQKLEEVIADGGDPVDEFTNEFKSAVRDLVKKTDAIYDEALSILSEAKNSDNITDKLKALKEVRDSLETQRKNFISLQQYGQRQQSNIYNINMKKENNIKLMLLDYANQLCPKCRNKVSELLIQEG